MGLDAPLGARHAMRARLPGGERVNLEKHPGFRSTQRLRIEEQPTAW